MAPITGNTLPSAVILGLSAALGLTTTETVHAQKQGGGAFAPAAPAKKKTVRRKAPRKPVQRTVVNFDGDYTAKIDLLSSSMSPCFSATRTFQLRNNVAIMKTWAMGDTVRGTVRGTNIVLFGRSDSSSNPWEWSGRVSIPRSNGQAGRGKLSASDQNGGRCDWNLTLTKAR